MGQMSTGPSAWTAASASADWKALGIQPAGAQAAAVEKSTDPQEAFLTLFLAQLKNQNPMDPQDSSAFLSQIAQFNTVSGIHKLNAGFEQLSQHLSSQKALEATAMVGHRVEVPASFGVLEVQNKPHDLPFDRQLYAMGPQERAQVYRGERPIAAHATIVCPDTGDVYFVDQGHLSDRVLPHFVPLAEREALRHAPQDADGAVAVTDAQQGWVRSLMASTHSAYGQQAHMGGQVVVPHHIPDLNIFIETPDGALVRHMALGPQAKGAVPWVWDGQNQTGERMPAGPYVVRAMGQVEGRDMQLETRMDFEVKSITIPGEDSGSVVLNLGSYPGLIGGASAELSVPMHQVRTVKA